MLQHTRVVVFLFYMCFSLRLSLCGYKDGTTRHIRDIFIGRCYEYQETRANISPKVSKKHCLTLFDVFAKNVGSKNDCKTNTSGIFDDFFNIVNPGLTPIDKALFWSGTNSAAHKLSFVNKNFITLEDTLAGYLANNLAFCGGNKTGDFNYTACNCQWSESVANSFWIGASKQFAENAQGVITVLMNGSMENAYRRNSFFGGVELPNLNTSLVKKMNIFIARDFISKPLATCKSENIMSLKQDLKNRGISSECLDDPNVVFYILCANSPESSVCKRHFPMKSKKTKGWKMIGLIMIGVCVVFVLIISLLGVILYRKRKATEEDKKHFNFS